MGAATHDVESRASPGEQFEMYGRTWTAVPKESRRRPGNTDRVVCVPAETTTAV
jgi:hypothetical protein